MSKISPTDLMFEPIFASDGAIEVKTTDKFRVETSTFNLGESTFFATYWRPNKYPLGLVFLCHGYGEYISPSYHEVAEALANQGLLVFGHDHVGHGRSSGQRVQVSSMAQYVQPVIAHIGKVRQEYGGNLPSFIVGHSMGGLITVFTTLEIQDILSGIVLMGPLIKMDPNMATPLNMFLVNVFKTLLPSIAIDKLDATAITRDEAVVNRVVEDPLNWNGGFRALHSFVLLSSTDSLANGKLLKTINIPALVLQGGKDRLVLPEGASFFFDNISSEDKKILIYPDAFHNLYVELEDVKTAAINETCVWIVQRAKK